MISGEARPSTKECNSVSSIPNLIYFPSTPEKEKAMKALRVIQNRFRTKKHFKINKSPSSVTDITIAESLFNKDIGYYYAYELHSMFAKGDILPYEDVCFIINRAIFLYSQIGPINHLHVEDNELNEDITIVGDLHGQLEDLYTIFLAKCIPTPTHTFVFNGDFIDRGSNAIEILLLTLYYKLLLPNNIYHNKGNHETKFCKHNNMNNGNNKGDFESEIFKKYPSHYKELIQLFTKLFDSFPVCTLINNEVLIVHGGIGEDMNINDISKIKKNDYDSRIMTELMWNDPRENLEGCEFNKKRNIGKIFGNDVSQSFCEKNDIKYIIRSHQYCEDGLNILHNNKIITLFSASYYCGINKNQGAIIILNHTLDPISIQYYSDKNLYHNFYKVPTIEEYINHLEVIEEEKDDDDDDEKQVEISKERIYEVENEMIKKISDNIGKIYYILCKYDRYNCGFIERFDLLFLLYQNFEIVLNTEIENSSMFVNYELFLSNCMNITSNISEKVDSIIYKYRANEDQSVLQLFKNKTRVKYDELYKVMCKVESDLNINDIYYLKRLLNNRNCVIDFEDYLSFLYIE